MRDDDILIVGIVGLAVVGYLLWIDSQNSLDQTDYSSQTPQDDGSGFVYDPSYDYTAPAPEESFTHVSPEAYHSAISFSTSPTGRSNIQQWEGYSNKAYQDIAGYWTIGIGHRIVPGDGLTSSSIISDQQVQDLFNQDLTIAENTIRSNVTANITQGMFDALVDFIFNLGAGNFANSTLLRLLNSSDYQGAANEFSKWVHAGSSVVPQLVARRAADAQIFVG